MTNDIQAKGNAVPIAKLSTGIAGLDEILHGGLPEGRTSLVTGGAGAGKTILAFQTIYNKARQGIPCIFMACEEKPEMLRENASSLGWNTEELEAQGLITYIPAELDPQVLLAGNADINGLLMITKAQMAHTGAKVLVIDGIDVLLRIFDDEHRQRNELHKIHQWLREAEVTTIITAKADQDPVSRLHDSLEYMVDCALLLDHRVISQVSTRRIRVRKYRGSQAGTNEYPYVLGARGLRVMPITSTHLRYTGNQDRISLGNADLDALISGGILRGTSVFICGASGIGKTTLAAGYACAASTRYEQTLYLSFEENSEAIVDNMGSVGIGLRERVADGSLRMVSILPEAQGVEEHLIAIMDEIAATEPRHLVVDALSAAARMGDATAAFDFCMRLMHLCKEKNITSVFVNQLIGTSDIRSVTASGLSSMADVIIFLNYEYCGAEIFRTFTVIKARGTNHSNIRHYFSLTSGGLILQGPALRPPTEPAGNGESHDINTTA